MLEKRKAGRGVAVVAVGGEAVDLVRIEPGIGAGRQDGLDHQGELRIGRLAVPVVRRLTDPGDGRPPSQCAVLHPSPFAMDSGGSVP
jgi:hypothetical protein